MLGATTATYHRPKMAFQDWLTQRQGRQWKCQLQSAIAARTDITTDFPWQQHNWALEVAVICHFDFSLVGAMIAAILVHLLSGYLQRPALRAVLDVISPVFLSKWSSHASSGRRVAVGDSPAHNRLVVVCHPVLIFSSSMSWRDREAPWECGCGAPLSPTKISPLPPP